MLSSLAYLTLWLQQLFTVHVDNYSLCARIGVTFEHHRGTKVKLRLEKNEAEGEDWHTASEEATMMDLSSMTTEIIHKLFLPPFPAYYQFCHGG